MLVVGEGRGGFDGVDADNRAAEALLVGTDLRGQIGQRWLAAELAAQLLAGSFQLTALTAHSTRPGILAEGIDHRPANTPLGERLELDTAGLVEAVRRIDETDDAVLDEVADIDGVGHRGRHPTRELFDEGDAVDDAGVVGAGLGAHVICCPPAHLYRNRSTKPRSLGHSDVMVVRARVLRSINGTRCSRAFVQFPHPRHALKRDKSSSC